MRTLFRTDGTSEEIPQRVSTEDIRKMLGARSLDIVNHVVDGRHVMFVDDLGHHKELPRNARGTAMYHMRCRPGASPPAIVGDVVVVPMADYGD